MKSHIKFEGPNENSYGVQSFNRFNEKEKKHLNHVLFLICDSYFGRCKHEQGRGTYMTLRSTLLKILKIFY